MINETIYCTMYRYRFWVFMVNLETEFLCSYGISILVEREMRSEQTAKFFYKMNKFYKMRVI